MKKWSVLCLAVAVGVCGCVKTEEKLEIDNDLFVAVDKKKIVTKDVAECSDFLELMEYWAEKNRPIANSLVAQKEQSYLGRFYRVKYFAFPDFRDEISGSGADAIKSYYAEQYRVAQTNRMDSLYEYDSIPDVPSQGFLYEVQVYSVEYAVPYLSVNFFSDRYGGGAHGLEGKYADVFDLRTGRKLELGDVVQITSAYETINALVVEHLLANDIPPVHDFDIRVTPPSSFRMTQEGLVLIFNPYEIAPYSCGIIEVPLYRMGGR